MAKGTGKQSSIGSSCQHPALPDPWSLRVLPPPRAWDNLKGRWIRERDGSEMGTIRHGMLRWAKSFGAPDSCLKVSESGEISLKLDGVKYTGVLEGPRKLVWSDGEIWNLREDLAWEAFEGTWIGPDGEMRGTICRGILRWADRHEGAKEVELQLLEGDDGAGSEPRILMPLLNTQHVGTLGVRPTSGGSRELTWSDGEIWRLVGCSGVIAAIAPVGPEVNVPTDKPSSRSATAQASQQPDRF